MPGCAAVGCNNRSEKGYIMKCFPRDPKLRKIWQDRVARADWEPSNNSFLCHVHFEPQEWSITQSGRIRLKKNAIPSIFTITSTRKSPKKRTKIVDKEENRLQKSVEGEEVEEEEEEEGFSYLNKDYFDSQESVVMIAKDKLRDVSNLVKQDNLEVQLNNNKEELELSTIVNNSNNMATIVKEEIKIEEMDHDILDDSYDEIEEKLKQICDGGSTEDDNVKKKEENKQQMKNHKGNENAGIMNCDINNEEHKIALSNHNVSAKNNKQENVEIIFGTESGDEKKIHKMDDPDLDFDELICIKDEKKVFNEDIEENFTKDEVHVIPNIRAAMKRKRRTREEIMKSIKKSIRSSSDHDPNSSSTSDATETEIGNELPMSSQDISDINKSNDTDLETTKFVIKVTGDPDDVTEIMEELSSNTFGSQPPKKLESVYKNEDNDIFVTSVITVMSPKNLSEIICNDFNSSLEKDVSVIDNSVCEVGDLANLDLLHNSEKGVFAYPKRLCSDEENKTRVGSNTPLQTRTYSVQTTLDSTGFCIPSDYEDLLDRIRIQENVISKLTDQVIIYKEMENSLRNKNSGRELQTKDAETASRINTRSSNMQATILNKKHLESKQRLIEDLSNKVNYFEEVNKKLMKTVTLESQQKRKLEGQIKQKDNRIKELNWKLEKASKYLERAEKNTNTYRRKMLNMQTIMRRRKLLDEKMSKFSEMLIDSSKQEFSDKVLSMAVDIRKACGRSGYDKLLSHGFPLPPLPALRRVLNEETMDNKEDASNDHNSTNISIKMENDQDTNNESDAIETDLKLADSMTKTTEYDGAETVTGTVQDIFDENNDGDDFSTNELREHFILQLNAVM